MSTHNVCFSEELQKIILLLSPNTLLICFTVSVSNFLISYRDSLTGNYSYETGSITGILGQLKWESLKKRS